MHDNVPKRGSKEYNKIIKIGCGSTQSWTDWGTEYDCVYNYPWICEDCPCVTGNMTNDKNVLIADSAVDLFK